MNCVKQFDSSLNSKLDYTRVSKMNFQTVDSQNRVLIQFYSAETANKVYRLDAASSGLTFQYSTNNGSNWTTIWSNH